MEKLDNRPAIHQLVVSFYEKVKADELLGPIFNNAENFEWETHIPIMVDFWESLLLDTNKYRGNPMIKHIELNRRTPLTEAHFERWKALFFATLDERFEGPQAQLARRRATDIAAIMLLKMQGPR